MSFPAGSYEDVRAWAESEFPTYFAAVTSFHDTTKLETGKLDGKYVDGTMVLQPMFIRALMLGFTKVTQLCAYARLTSDSDVEIVREVMFDAEDEPILFYYLDSITDLGEVDMDKPWACPIETGHPAGIDRLETLIRFFYLKNGEKNAVLPKLGFFKTHFRAACRDVARATGAIVEVDEVEDDDTIPDESLPDLMADTDTAGLCDKPTATAVFNSNVHAMDESYHDFKTSMLRQLGAIQTIDGENMAQLQTHNQNLKQSLAVSEEGRARLGKELDAEKAKVKAATEEAASWKAQYEGLKGMLQGALGQQF